ncbi:MAG: hypothetical protein C0485_06430 [Pirellula sp.]|nr:hypothetical protein [Pirellula sp.]
MTHISVPLSDDVRRLAEIAAEESGLPLDQFVSLCIARTVTKRSDDPMFANITAYEGDAPTDMAENHDEYLYGEDA